MRFLIVGLMSLGDCCALAATGWVTWFRWPDDVVAALLAGGASLLLSAYMIGVTVLVWVTMHEAVASDERQE